MSTRIFPATYQCSMAMFCYIMKSKGRGWSRGGKVSEIDWWRKRLTAASDEEVMRKKKDSYPVRNDLQTMDTCSDLYPARQCSREIFNECRRQRSGIDHRHCLGNPSTEVSICRWHSRFFLRCETPTFTRLPTASEDAKLERLPYQRDRRHRHHQVSWSIRSHGWLTGTGLDHVSRWSLPYLVSDRQVSIESHDSGRRSFATGEISELNLHCSSILSSCQWRHWSRGAFHWSIPLRQWENILMPDPHVHIFINFIMMHFFDDNGFSSSHWILFSFLVWSSSQQSARAPTSVEIMSVRSEREKSKMQEKYQLVLSQMLKEDDNRFCVDCDTKSKQQPANPCCSSLLRTSRSSMG